MDFTTAGGRVQKPDTQTVCKPSHEHTTQNTKLLLQLQAAVTARKRMKIWWMSLLLLLCESKRDGHGQERDVLYCRHQNRILNVSGQMLLLTWEDDPSCSALTEPLIYELSVFIADKLVHNDTVAVTSDQIGSTHSWNWTSHLALKDTEHSVRLISRPTSYASLCNFPGQSNGTEIYPKDTFFEVGSIVTFCCVVAPGKSFEKMYLSGYNTASRSSAKTSEIRNRTYALRVHFHQTTKSFIDVLCETNNALAGTCTHIGRPPQDRNLQCETRDLESAQCYWTVGSVVSRQNPTTYQLLGSTCEHGHEGRCSLKKPVKAGEENWVLTAQNKLGKLVLHDSGDLMKRVHMLGPDGVSASIVSARHAVLEWTWTARRYQHLNLTCQANVSHSITSTITVDSGVGLNATALHNLIPNWEYKVQVRCAPAQDFWKWGDWSESVTFHTEGDVPDAPDVWMHMKGNSTVIWKKPLANQSHGDIIQYEVTWSKRNTTDPPYQVNVTQSEHNHTLPLDPREEHVVMVTARNKHGKSAPSSIVIPKEDSDRSSLRASWITGMDGGFNLSWQPSPAASCGYIVDWHPDLTLGPVEWMKLPPNQTSTRITSSKSLPMDSCDLKVEKLFPGVSTHHSPENLRDGLRYWLSLYACTQGAAELLSLMEGYTREKGIRRRLFKLRYEQQDSDVVISWDPIPLEQQSAFIHGYVLHCQANGEVVLSVRSDQTEATSLRASNLKPDSYVFTVAALTAVGEGGETSISGTLSPQMDKLIRTIIFSLGGVCCVLLFLIILCCRHWACIKQKIYPPLPKPLLTDQWMTSPVVRGYPALLGELSNHSKESLDTPELLYKPGEAIQEHTYSACSQTPAESYSGLEECLPASLVLPNNAIPHPAALPSSCTGMFPNLSYNLVIKGIDQQPSSKPDLQKGIPMVSDEYQPQSYLNASPTLREEDPVGPVGPVGQMPCDSTYILLPASSKP